MNKAALAAWVAFILAVAGLNYASRAVGGKPPKDLLYHWSTVVGNVVQYAIIALIVYGIAGLGNRRVLFALRPPTSWRRAGRIALGIAGGMIVLSVVLTPLLNPGREQGYTPSNWEGRHAAAYIANGVAIAVFAPIVEELTFRGLGFSLLQPFGATAAIVLVGVSFGLWHGLVEALPLLVAFGAGLAYLRYRVDSVYPGMIVHGLFNAVSLTIAVAH